MKLLHPTTRRPRGFTLVEILTVITIIAILAAIGFGGFRVAINKSNSKKTIATLTAMMNNLQSYKNDAGEYPEPTNKDTTVEVKGKSFISGGAEMLYQIMSGDGDNAIKGGTDPSTGQAGSKGKVYWEEAIAPTPKEVEAKKSKPLVGVSDNNAYFMKDGFSRPFRYIKALKDRNKRIGNADEMHSDGDYELWSYGTLTEPNEDPEAQKEWISNWATN